MKDQPILIKNATIVTQNERREIIKGNIAISKGRIDYIGNEELDTEATIDATDKIVIPGFINTHCHVAMTHLRGKLDDIKLSEFLERTFKMDAERSNEGLYNSSLLGAFEMLNSGITSFLDLYYSEDVIAKAVQESGIRGFLAWNTLDSDKTTQKGDPLSNAEHFIESIKDMDRVHPSIGVQGVYVASDEVYLKAKEISERYNTIIHGHLSETREEVYNFTKTHNGERPAEHLGKIGFLNDRFIAAHCVWLTLREAKELGKNRVGVSWNSISNEFLGTGGIPPIPELRDNGAIVSLGTDSSASNNALDPFQ
ncbi:MAG: amidohydrolase family protein, partial [Candidatus Thermoplasmatota archaeon]|nr:amidohydrolase family protein [Candidatus Thermoplasmatota archaeon]